MLIGIWQILFIGEEYSHASVMKRVHEMSIKELIQIGIRSASKEEENFVENHSNIMTFKSNEVFSHLDNIEYYLSAVDTPIYLSIDMDVFDPVCCSNCWQSNSRWNII